METIHKPKTAALSAGIIVAIVIISLLAGGALGYSIYYLTTSEDMKNLQNEVSTLREQVTNLQPTQTIVNQNSTYFFGNASLSKLYSQVKDAVVAIRGLTVQYDIFHRPYYSQVQGSGFVYNFSGKTVVITNYHVVQETINITVTFINGDGYGATILGSDAYADLALLSMTAEQTGFEALDVVSTSTLEVGDPVVAVGNPYGLAGSMTAGIVSALGRTITEDMSGSYPIANVIQTNAAINPGNSGGPLLNYQGQVVGITTAIVTDSEGLGFAIPSSTILREVESLVTNGSYDRHPWLGASGTDMTYEIAQTIGTNVTYGWLIAQITSGGPADNAGLKGGTKQVVVAGSYVTIGGDIIVAINGARITSLDDLSTYLEEHASPNQTINITILRNNETTDISLTLGTRPSST